MSAYRGMSRHRNLTASCPLVTVSRLTCYVGGVPHRLVRGKSQNAHSSGIPALRRPSIIRSYIARKSGLACGAIVALSAAIDTLARFGGDKFAHANGGRRRSDGCRVLANKLLQRMTTPLHRAQSVVRDEGGAMGMRKRMRRRAYASLLDSAGIVIAKLVPGPSASSTGMDACLVRRRLPFTPQFVTTFTRSKQPALTRQQTVMAKMGEIPVNDFYVRGRQAPQRRSALARHVLRAGEDAPRSKRPLGLLQDHCDNPGRSGVSPGGRGWLSAD